MFAYDKLFILLSYFNNMRPPIQNTQLTHSILRVTRKKDVLVDCQCRTWREVKWNFALWTNCTYKAYYYMLCSWVKIDTRVIMKLRLTLENNVETVVKTWKVSKGAEARS